jgi:hypothetical protein
MGAVSQRKEKEEKKITCSNFIDFSRDILEKVKILEKFYFFVLKLIFNLLLEAPQ